MYTVHASGRRVPTLDVNTKYENKATAITRAKRLRELLPKDYGYICVIKDYAKPSMEVAWQIHNQ